MPPSHKLLMVARKEIFQRDEAVLGCGEDAQHGSSKVVYSWQLAHHTTISKIERSVLATRADATS